MVNMQWDRVDAMFMGVSAVILFVSPINSRFSAERRKKYDIFNFIKSLSAKVEERSYPTTDWGFLSPNRF